MKPFLFCSARPEVEAVGPEYESVRSAMDLDAGRLEHHRLDVAGLERQDLSAFAGVVVGGSPFNVTTPPEHVSEVQRRVEDDLAWLAERGLAGDVPVLFTCYGIGVLTRVLGGEVGLDHGEEAQAVRVELTDDGVRDPLTGVLPPAFEALVGHKEATVRLPERATLLAGSATCPVQVYRVGTRVYATQFHPEVTPADFVARARVYRHHGYFPAREMAAVEARINGASVTWPRTMLARFAELFG